MQTTCYVDHMRVSDIISTKSGVVTLPPTATITELIAVLAERRIGAVVIVDELGLAGIVSERDVIRYINGTENPADPVADIMTTTVHTCRPTDDLGELASVMTNERIRHLPVLEGGNLVGIVSIGDVVKARLDDLEAERDHLERYVHG